MQSACSFRLFQSLYDSFAGNEAWLQYFQLFDESRFVHVTSIDFLLLTAFVPFWLVSSSMLHEGGLCRVLHGGLVCFCTSCRYAQCHSLSKSPRYDHVGLQVNDAEFRNSQYK